MSKLSKREQIAAMIAASVWAKAFEMHRLGHGGVEVEGEIEKASVGSADRILSALAATESESEPDLAGTIFEDFKEGMLLEMEREGDVDSSGFPDAVWLTHDGGASVKYVTEHSTIQDVPEPDPRDARTAEMEREALRFYNPDGSFEVLASADEVREKRIAAAKKLQAFDEVLMDFIAVATEDGAIDPDVWDDPFESRLAAYLRDHAEDHARLVDLCNEREAADGK